MNRFENPAMFWVFLQISRPGWWLPTVFLYLLPTSGRWDLLTGMDPCFFLGLIYVTFPLNFFTYGWNDFVDYDIDKNNPRKGNYLYGARATKEQLSVVPLAIILTQIPFLVLMYLCSGVTILYWFFACIAVNGAYNHPGVQLSSTPPLDLVAPLGYLLTIYLSSELNNLPMLPSVSVAYTVLLVIRTQMWTQIMDLVPDLAAGAYSQAHLSFDFAYLIESGRRTSVTVLGAKSSKLLLLALIVAEALLAVTCFNDTILSVFEILGVLMVTVEVVFQEKLSVEKMKLTGIVNNAAGFVLLVYCWLNKVFLT
eukprot:m.310326 g.310326  ORF g.310326 m.310326 type:complete len:310 (+) comp16476_c0_seq6:328-1257(+)